jgi:hypothetical protein
MVWKKEGESATHQALEESLALTRACEFTVRSLALDTCSTQTTPCHREGVSEMRLSSVRCRAHETIITGIQSEATSISSF